MTRGRIVQTIADLIGFAAVRASRVGSSGSTEVQVDASEDDASDKWSELWAHTPLLYKPVAGTEQLYVELGDERVVFATKDRRWQIETADGEVVLRAVGAGSPAYVKLKPDGTAELHATSINLGGEAEHFIALANLVNDRLSTLQAAFDAHTHLTAGTGSPVGPTLLTPAPGAPTIPVGTLGSVAATKVKAE